MPESEAEAAYLSFSREANVSFYGNDRDAVGAELVRIIAAAERRGAIAAFQTCEKIVYLRSTMFGGEPLDRNESSIVQHILKAIQSATPPTGG